MKLRVEHQVIEEHVLDAERVVAVGRAQAADISIDYVCMTRHHFHIGCTDGTWWVEDAGSMSGTYVNGAQTPPQVRRPVTPEDTIDPGKTKLRLVR